jgi:hypothetical protein
MLHTQHPAGPLAAAVIIAGSLYFLFCAEKEIVGGLEDFFNLFVPARTVRNVPPSLTPLDLAQ